MSSVSKPMRHLRHSLTAAMAFAVAQPALSQQAGVYVGTTSQGGQVEVFVDPSLSGGLVFSMMGHQLSADCDAGADKLAWWYVPLFDAPASTEPVATELKTSFIYERSTLQFTADGSAVVGNFEVTLPAFASRKRSDWSATRCDTGTVTFRAEWQPPSAETVLARKRLPVGRGVWAARGDSHTRVLSWTMEQPER